MRSAWLDELQQILRLGAPLAAVAAGNQLMSAVDTSVVGRLGATELGAVGLGNSIFFGFAIFGIGIVLGLDPLISQALGAGDVVRARRLLWQGIWLGLLIAAGLVAPVAATALSLEAMGIPAETARMARLFLWVRLPGLFPLLAFFCLRAYVQAWGRTRALVVAMVTANAVNFALDLLLVFGGAALPAWAGPLRRLPAVGFVGTAISTTLCLGVQLAIVAWAISHAPSPPLPADLRRPRARELAMAFRVGLPVGLQYGAEVGVFTLVGIFAGRLGPGPLASHQIALTLAGMSFMMALGLSSAASVRVGRAVGAGDTARARLAGLLSFGAAVTAMSAAAVAFLLFPTELAALVTDQPDAIAAAAPLLLVAAFFQISDGVQGVGAGILRGAGDTRFAFLANLFGHYAIGLPVALFLGVGLHWGVVGLWWGLCAGLSAVGAILLVRFLRLSSRPIRALHGRAAEGE